MQAATTWNLKNGKNMLIITEDDGHQHWNKLPVFDMSSLKPIENKFSLDPEQQYLFNKALETTKGKQIVSQLRNEKTNVRVNAFFKSLDNKLGKSSRTGYFKNVFKQIIAEPMNNVIGINNLTIGLTKKEIYKAFLAAGLIH